MSRSEVRELLAAALGYEPREGVWAYLVNECYVESVEQGEEDVNWLRGKYLAVLKAAGHPVIDVPDAPRMLPKEERPGRHPPGDAPDARAGREARVRTLSALFAEDAARDPQVIAFRQEKIGGALIAPEKVEGWIKGRAAEEGRPDTWVRVPTRLLSDALRTREEGRPAAVLTLLREITQTANEPVQKSQELADGKSRPDVPPDDIGFRFVFYGTPRDRRRRLQAVAAGGTLDRLSRLSTYLARRFQWDQAQATLFVLTGQTPRVSDARVTFSPGEIPARSRLDLQVDPSLTPAEVAEEYRRARAMVLPGRHRALSVKHLTLAAFLATTPDCTWRTRMAQWNTEHPNWKYAQVTNFARDAQIAHRRLLHLGDAKPQKVGPEGGGRGW